MFINVIEMLPEIGMINNADVRDALVTYFNKCVDMQFFKAPSSSSGKYHPADEICDGGLVLHTRKVCRLAVELVKALPDAYNNCYINDIVVVAALLHDSAKSGSINCWGEHTIFDHPVVAAKNILNYADSLMSDVRDIFTAAASLVETHMGKWNVSRDGLSTLPVPSSELQQVLHTADFIASRKYVSIEL